MKKGIGRPTKLRRACAGAFAMKISEIILRKVEAIGEDTTGTTAEEVRSKAVAATLGGIGSPAWLEYMRMFAETGEQLARLTPPPGPADSSELREALAYLVASGAAGVDSFRLAD